jgi:hypothetical protein
MQPLRCVSGRALAINPTAPCRICALNGANFVVAFSTKAGVKPHTRLAHLFAMLVAPNDQGFEISNTGATIETYFSAFLIFNTDF